MKRICVGLILMIGASLTIFEPVEPEPEPVPIEDKPVVTNNVREWYMYDKLMSREYKVINPDGSTVWLKYTDKTAPKIADVQSKADNLWQAQKEAEANKHNICPYCGQLILKGIVP